MERPKLSTYGPSWYPIYKSFRNIWSTIILFFHFHRPGPCARTISSLALLKSRSRLLISSFKSSTSLEVEANSSFKDSLSCLSELVSRPFLHSLLPTASLVGGKNLHFFQVFPLFGPEYLPVLRSNHRSK